MDLFFDVAGATHLSRSRQATTEAANVRQGKVVDWQFGTPSPIILSDAGGQLANPACGGPTPNDDSEIW